MTLRPAPALPIRTDRLTLRAAVPDDLERVLPFWGDPEVARYLPFAALDRAGAMKRLVRLLDATDPRCTGEALILVAELTETGEVVGDVMLRLGAGDPPGVAELGWVFHPAYGGRGLATEAARALRDLAVGPFGCHRVEAVLDPRNTASARLCERLGMTLEGVTRQDFPKDGRWGDTAHYAVLAADLTRGEGR